MKKNITTAVASCILVACSVHVQAQTPAKRFYLKAAGGYFLSVSPGQFPNVGTYEPKETFSTYNTSTGATTVVSEKVLTGSYGGGARGGLTAGYDLSRYIALELAVNYYHSKTNLMTHNVTTAQGSSTVLASVEAHGHVNAIDLAPAIVFNAGMAGKVNPYVRIGAVVPVWGRLYISTDGYRAGAVAGQPTLSSQLTVHREEAIKPNATVGFQGALGVTYSISNNFSLFLETEYRNVPVEGKSKEVNEYNELLKVISNTNGATVSTTTRGVNDLSTAERNTHYVTTLTTDSNTPTGTTDPAHPTQTQYKDNNKAADDLKSYINIGGLGLNLGLKIRI